MKTIGPAAVWTLALIVTLGLILPDVVFAQSTGAASGGNAGWVQSVITSFTTNILGGIIQATVIGLGVLMMVMRWHMVTAGMIIIGALVADNYQTIAALL